MKLSAVAIDYDGTIALDGRFDPSVREVIAELRLDGIAVVLVTGRRLDELQAVAGNLGCFNAVVAENGAVFYFPESGRKAVLGHAPDPRFLECLRKRGLAFTVGESVIELEAATAPAVLESIRSLEQPLMLAFNHSRLMVLPPGIAKSTGLRRVLSTLRLSIHNTIGIGDAENDHDLLDACEVGVAVAWGSATLRAVADEIIDGTGPPAVAGYLRSLAGQIRLSPRQMGRRRLLLGQEHDGRPVHLVIRGRNVLIAGEPGSGKSWLAGLLAEQLILQRYCLCIIDPEGDYRSLQAMPGVVLLGGDEPPPRAHELEKALRHPDASVLLDLVKLSHHEKQGYLRELLPWLASLRRQTGLPHRILLDEAHYYVGGPEGGRLLDAELAGYTLVSYRVSAIDPKVRSAADMVVIVTRETDRQEQETLRSICAAAHVDVPGDAFKHLALNEAALLPGADESGGLLRRFEIAPRLTSHVRHRRKYLEMPVSEHQAFVFTADGRLGRRAHSMTEFLDAINLLPDTDLAPHLRRHDFSKWIEHVFRDCPLATHLRTIEDHIATDDTRDVIDDIAQAIRARYEMTAPAPT
jgi:hydroxymethylpyrimidine pyrophosphatase-like HAD family hydrolase